MNTSFCNLLFLIAIWYPKGTYSTDISHTDEYFDFLYFAVSNVFQNISKGHIKNWYILVASKKNKS